MTSTRGGTATLRVAVRGGPVDVPVTWTGPADGDAVGLVLLQHGFTRHPRHLSGLAERLAAEGLASARPRVASLRRARTFNDPTFVTALTLALVAGVEDDDRRAGLRDDTGVRLSARPAIVVMGHSAGAAVALHQAAVLAERAGPLLPAGVVLLDGADTVTGMGATAIPGLAATPVRVIDARPSRCNRRGQLTGLLAGTRTGFLGVRLVAGGHGDAEDPIGVRPPAAYRLGCGDATAAEDRLLVHRLAALWAAGLAAGEPQPRPGEADLAPLELDGRLVLLTAGGHDSRPATRPTTMI